MRVLRIAAAVSVVLIAATGVNAQTVASTSATTSTPLPSPTNPLSYRQCLDLLQQSNRALRNARLQLDVSRAEVRRADVAPNPSLSASVSNSTARRYQVPDSDWIVRVEQLFERGGKRGLRTAGARALERAASLDIRETARQQRLALAQAYFELVATQQAQALALETVAGHERLRLAAERRLLAGDIAAVDVSRLRVEEGRARNEARSAAAAAEQARIALALTLGIETRATALTASDEFLPLEQPVPQPHDLELALARRPDVAALIARIEALEQARALALAQRTRDVTLGVQTERAPSLGGNVFGISASIPLFLNNDFSGDIARADADLSIAREELARVRGLIQADAARARALLQSAAERVRRIDQTSIPAASQAAQAIEFAFSRGAATLTDLFDARRQLAAVRVEALAARADYSKAVLVWREAVLHEEVNP
jgi:cobalt-zinc-cadmium efflux system outer membrane protein